MPKHYQGLIPAAFTPFTSAGDLNLSLVPALARHFGSLKLPGVFVCGTTGESASLTTEERMQVAEAWWSHAPPGLDVIVHVGHNSQRDAVALAAHARQIGAAAVAALAPSYFRPSSPEDLVTFLRPIAAAAGDLPFYFYDIPSMTGVSFPADRVLALLAASIPNLAGIKFTNPDLMRLSTCLAHADGKYDILFGIDEALLGALAVGVKGGVGSTYNYAAPVYQKMIADFAAGNVESARASARKSAAIVDILHAHGGLRAGKALLALSGFDFGPVRSPLKPVGAEEMAEIRRKWEAV